MSRAPDHLLMSDERWAQLSEQERDAHRLALFTWRQARRAERDTNPLPAPLGRIGTGRVRPDRRRVCTIEQLTTGRYVGRCDCGWRSPTYRMWHWAVGRITSHRKTCPYCR